MCRGWILLAGFLCLGCGGNPGELPTRDTGSLLIRVALTSDVPVNGCTARLLGTHHSAVCDDNGEFVLSDVWTGEWDLEIESLDPALDGLRPVTRQVASNPGRTSELTVIMYRAGAAHGHVTGDAPKVGLITSEGAHALSNSDGLYYLPGVPPGDRDFHAFVDGGVISHGGIPVEEGELTAPLDFALAGMSFDGGRVVIVVVVGVETLMGIMVRAVLTKEGIMVVLLREITVLLRDITVRHRMEWCHALL
jgi:hypothetical protein